MKMHVLIYLMLIGGTMQARQLGVTHLEVEYKSNPVGLTETAPRISWQLTSAKNNTLQTAYEVRVAMTAGDVQSGKNLTWHSGRIESDQSTHLPYAGPELKSRQRYHWQVRVWDNHQRSSDWSAVQHWEMGLLATDDWQAKWIGVPWPEDEKVSQPVALLRTAFELDSKIQSARLYITAQGLYEASLNGMKVGDEEFTPGWTAYRTHLQYQTFDVTDLLQSGDNVLGVQLADGWFRGNLGFRGQRNTYGKQTAILAQLELVDENGKQHTIISDENWQAATGARLVSDIYNGEKYDARLEKNNWDTPQYSAGEWHQAEVRDWPETRLMGPVGPPVRQIDRLAAKEIFVTAEGDTVIDFGQNLVGVVQMKVDAARGTKIILHHAEVLDKDGNFYIDNLRTAKQEAIYIARGQGEEIYQPKFTFMGFRYLRVRGWPGMPKKDDFMAIAIHSDMPVTGTFACSEPLINQLQHNIQWGQKGNFLDVPTDCPQRNERLGWTGDAQVFCRTAAFNMDVATFFHKWLADLEADQNPDGSVPHVIPNALAPQASGSAGWADAVTIVPWAMYEAYGDVRFLERSYDSMKNWVECIRGRAGADLLWDQGPHFGDWLFYRPRDDNSGRAAVTDKILIAQSFFAHSTDLLARTANILGKKKDAKAYAALFDSLKTVYQENFLTPSGRLVSNTQTAYVLALNFGLLPDGRVANARARLAQNIKSYGNHLTTGFLGTPNLCHVLSEAGELDLAYTLLQRESYPSWLYPVRMGATTIWERWDGIRPDGSFQTPGMNSFNHYAYGAIGDWMYKVVAGINPDIEKPGYKHIILAPRPGGTLSFAKATHQSLYGEIASSWQRKGKKLEMRVSVPPNTTATLRFPVSEATAVKPNAGVQADEAGAYILLGSGQYDFRCDYPALVSSDEKD